MINFMRWIICIFLLSCSHHSLEECRRQGELEALRLAKDLESVETIQDLKILEFKIKKRLDKITDLMVAAHKSRHIDTDFEAGEANERLLHAMTKIYGLEGGQEAFEQIAVGSLQKLQLKLH